MKRIPEPEIMNGREQTDAYAAADFEGPNQMFVDQFQAVFPEFKGKGQILDLGCGPADILIRFARRYPDCILTGVDGAARMLEHGHSAIASQGLSERIKLLEGVLPQVNLPQAHFETILSNSLLHHLDNPAVLWQTIKKSAKKWAAILVMDLFRPTNREQAREIVEKYSGNEATILKDDFYHSLLAAYSVDEVIEQLERAGLNRLKVEKISDRHLITAGFL